MTGRQAAAGLAGAVVGVVLVWSALLAGAHLAARATVLDRLESSLLDLRVTAFGRRPAPAGVVIAAIDDAAVRRGGGFPLPRRLLAQAVTALLDGGAAAVVLDTLFLDPGPAEGDEALAHALAAGPTALAAMLSFAAGDASDARVPCVLPIAAIRQNAGAGTVNIALEPSGVARHVPMLLPCGNGLLPALPLKAASLAGKTDPAFAADAVAIGGVTTPLDAGRNLALRYYGPEGSITTISVAELLAGTVPAAALRGRTVVVGATAGGVGDRYPTPFDSILPGVEIMATAIANLETGDALERTPRIRRIDAGLTIGMALAAAGCLLVGHIGLGLVGLLALVAAWLALVLVGFAHGVWFAMAVPLAALVPAAALAGAGRLALDRWTEARLRRDGATLAAFQSPAMLARLTQNPDFLAQPVEREIAAVFIDLSGFTGLSERLGASVTRDLLRDWHAIVEEGSAAQGGFVASYMADGAMVVWGMEERRADDALRAVRGAIALQDATLAWLRTIAPVTGPLSVKVGGHLGPAILSRLGHATHQHITAIGDMVNVASRLMEVAAAFHTTMALGEPLVAAARAQGFSEAEDRFTPPFDAPIRGRAQPLSICLWTGQGAAAAAEAAAHHAS